MKTLFITINLLTSALAERFEKGGIAVDFTTVPEKPIAGEEVTFCFAISDTTTGGTINRAYPAAWIDPVSVEPPAKKIERFIQGGLFGQAELDLNVYYVITLNDDASVSVVDPRFGVGSTKLLSLIPLPGVGFDWVLSKDETQLFVSVPSAEKIVVIDTRKWKVISEIEVPATHLTLQPDGHYLWASDGKSHLTAIANGKILGKISGGPEISFSDDHRHAFVSTDDGIAVIDLHKLETVREMKLGFEPRSLAYSSLAQALYVSGEEVVVMDEKKIITRISSKQPLDQLRFSPGGRYAFVLSSEGNRVQIIDASSNTIIQNCEALGHPTCVAFSDEIAYLSDRDSAEVGCVLLAQIGKPGQPISIATFPAGQLPPGDPPAAELIVQAPGHSAVLVANPEDKIIYFYKEGMAAPMGSFQNYSRKPLAVEVVDRSLSERTSAGVYQSGGRLSKPGTYDVCFFLDSPRLIHRFEVTVGGEMKAQRGGEILAVKARKSVQLGDEATIDFQLHLSEDLLSSARIGAVNSSNDAREIEQRTTDTTSGNYVPKVPGHSPALSPAMPEFIHILIYQTPGTWRTRLTAKHQGRGLYALKFKAPRTGAYYANVSRVPGYQNIKAPQPSILTVVTP